MIKKYLLALLFVIILISGLSSEAYAQGTTGYNLGVQPTTLVVNLKQGEKIKEDILVTNNEKVPITISLSIMNFKALNGGSSVSFYSPKDNTDLSNWIKPELTTVTIPALSAQYETLDFSIPSYVLSGTYSGVLFLEPNLAASHFASGSNVVTRAGINLLVNVSKDINEYSSLYKPSQLENFAVPIFNTTSIPISGDIKNTTVFAQSESITFKASPIVFGKSVSKTFKDIDILPGSYRYLDGNNKVIKLTGVQFGLYKGTVQIHDNLKNTDQNKTFYFTLIPVLYIIVLLFIVVILIASIFLINYAIHKRRKKYY